MTSKSFRTWGYTLNEYSADAHEFASDVGQELVHRTLGLVGEAGEVAENVKKHFRDCTPLDRDTMVKELGDVLWYVATLATLFGSSLEEVANTNIQKLTDRQNRGKLGGSGDNR